MGENRTYPSYISLVESGEIEKRIEKLYELLSPCRLCPRKCKARRKENKFGFCRLGESPKVSSYNLHFGEEPPISGYNGSGTIFFTGCNLGCVFCQNYPISHLHHGREVTVDELSSMMLYLQRKGAHNINLVTPTPQVHAIVKAIDIAAKKGLRIPIVYNCGGYESEEVLDLLDGIVDIYMPDMKYGNNESARKYSGAKDYVEIAKRAIKKMHDQVGDLTFNEDGTAKRGLLVRHLVLPNDLSGTEEVLKFIRYEISRNTYVSLMSQYFPAYRASEFPELSRRITREEFKRAEDTLISLGLTNGWIQKI